MAEPTAPNYPGSLDSQTSLFGYTNIASYTLTGAINDTVDNFTVNEVITALEVPCYLKFSTGETVYVEAKTPATKTLSTITRGVAGTTATSHSASEEMRGILVAEHMDQIRDAIIAVETELGADPAGGFTNVVTRLNTNFFETTNGNVESLSANKSLVDADAALQILTPSANDRDVTLPAEASTNHAYIIVNPSASFNIVVKDDTPTTLETLLEDEAAICVSDGTNWFALKIDVKKDTYLRLGQLRANSGGTKTISTGAITVAPRTDDAAFYLVAAESGTADDLTSISGGAEDDIIILKADAGDTITLVPGTGSGALTFDSTVTLEGEDLVMLRHDGTDWSIVGGSGSGGGGSETPSGGGYIDISTSYQTLVAAPSANRRKVFGLTFINQDSSVTTEFYFKLVKSAVDYFEMPVQLAPGEMFILDFPIILDTNSSLQVKAADTVDGAATATYVDNAKEYSAFVAITGATWQDVLNLGASDEYVVRNVAIINNQSTQEDMGIRVYDGVSVAKFSITRTVPANSAYFLEIDLWLANSYELEVQHSTAAYDGDCIVMYEVVS
jgi:hypothetical protein